MTMLLGEHVARVRAFVVPTRYEPLAKPKYPALAEAAEYARNGWTRGDMYLNGQFCMMGAILQAKGVPLATGGEGMGLLRTIYHIIRGFGIILFDPDVKRVGRAVPFTADHWLGAQATWSQKFIANTILRKVPALRIVAWNDERATKTQVVELLERTAYIPTASTAVSPKPAPMLLRGDFAVQSN